MLISDVARLSNVACQKQKGSKSILFQRISSLGREVVDELCDSKNIIESDDEKDLSVQEVGPMDSSAATAKVRKSPTSNDGNSKFITQIYESLDQWEEPELQPTMQSVSKTLNIYLST